MDSVYGSILVKPLGYSRDHKVRRVVNLSSLLVLSLPCHDTVQHLNIQFPSPQHCEKVTSVSYKLPGTWPSIIEAKVGTKNKVSGYSDSWKQH